MSGVSDAILLEEVSEDSFVSNLKVRFDEKVIYVIFYLIKTYIGDVVVSVNPYQQVDLYGQNVIEEYRGKNIFELPPHML